MCFAERIQASIEQPSQTTELAALNQLFIDTLKEVYGNEIECHGSVGPP